VKKIKFIAYIGLVVLGIIQFFPTDKNESNLILDTDFMKVNKVPLEVEKQIKVSCYDCHSNNTVYPWYSKLQPAAWFLEDHINEGKVELNFSEWGAYSNRRKVSKLQSIIKQIENSEMPLYSYTLLHRDAIFSEQEKLMVIDFMSRLKDSKE